MTTLSAVAAAPVIEFEDVHKAFRGHPGFLRVLLGRDDGGQAVRALDGVSFRLGQGRVLGVAGESGSGKSTLANVLVGLERPTSGHIRVAGQDIAGLRGPALRGFRRSVQMVFQDPFASLNPRFTIRRTVEEPLVIHGMGERAARLGRTIEALEEAELRPAEHFLERFPHELSGGQRQRVAIARAIVLRPRVLVADEPVSMLDVSVRAGVLRLLRRLVDRFTMALIFITHDLSLIGQMCDDLAIMYRGRFVEVGPALQVLATPLHPYTRQLIAAVPVPDPTRRPAELPAGLLEAAHAPPPPGACPFSPRCAHAVAHCRTEVPSLRRIGDLHRAACHRSEEL